jgi:hypothetical protein
LQLGEQDPVHMTIKVILNNLQTLSRPRLYVILTSKITGDQNYEINRI